jgi:hypothetical protein
MGKSTAKLLILAAFLASALTAQETPPPADESVCNDEFAKFLVDQQVSESRSVAETNKRIRILAKSA